MEKCIDCGRLPIQNKRKKLCGDCIFKLNHNGKTKQEVYMARSKTMSLQLPKSFLSGNMNYDKIVVVGDEERINMLKQQIAEESEREELEAFKKIKKYKSIKKVSETQKEINKLYRDTCKSMDYIKEPMCEECLRYQGGDIALSHSHIVSQADCKRFGLIPLIWEYDNIKLHCMDFGDNKGCHQKWENREERKKMRTYKENIEYIKSLGREDVLNHYLK